jgi:hypothetical protein
MNVTNDRFPDTKKVRRAVARPLDRLREREAERAHPLERRPVVEARRELRERLACGRLWHREDRRGAGTPIGTRTHGQVARAVKSTALTDD